MCLKRSKLDEATLHAAETLVIRVGTGFTMAQLAGEMGISRATLYRRVPSKTVILEALHARGLVPAPVAEEASSRILEATARQIRQHGFENLTVERIAADAGVSTVTIYRLFKTRENLLLQFFETFGPRRDAARILSQTKQTSEQTLIEFVDTTISWARENPGLWRALFLAQGETGKYLQKLRAGQVGTFERLIAYLATQVEVGALAGEPRELAISLLAMTTGALFIEPRIRSLERARVAGIEDMPTAREMAAQIVKIFLYGTASKHRAEGKKHV